MPAVAEELEFAIFDPSKFPKQTKRSGRSEFYDKITSGPSYIAPENRKAPIKLSGTLQDKYGKYATDSTPLLGTEYSAEVQISDLLKEDDESVLRDLAATISRRGVVFFRNQNLTTTEQKRFVHILGQLSGKPATSGLHIHPSAPAGGVLDKETKLIDPEVSFIASRIGKEYKFRDPNATRHSESWHSDITFEPVPSDYTSLKLTELPITGGDTLWANGYALLEKFSPSFRAYLETLTGTYSQDMFNKLSDLKNFDLYSETRGAPENYGDELIAKHPIVRTNPVTGWKSLFAVGHHFTAINEVSPIESALIKKFILDTLVASHDIQVRFKWNINDLAIWDNRSAYHAATFDFIGISERTGVRTVGIGERPYLDPKSTLQGEEVVAELSAAAEKLSV